MTPLDPFTVEVIRHGLSAAAEEMSLVLVRSARSPLLREAGDLSSSLTDANGDLIGQGRDIPVHLGAMAYTVRELLKMVPASKMRDGHAFIYNLGALGGNHLNDVKVVRPIFVDGAIIAFAISLAHWPDVGGTWPGSYYATATDTFQEAIRIPPVLIATLHGVSSAVMEMIKANVRDPVSCEGDLLGQIAATSAAERRIRELCATHGADTFPCRHRPAARPLGGGDARRPAGAAGRRPTRARTSSTMAVPATARPACMSASRSRATRRPSTCRAATTVWLIFATPRRSSPAPP